MSGSPPYAYRGHSVCRASAARGQWPFMDDRATGLHADRTPLSTDAHAARAYALGIVLLLAAALLWSLNGALIKLVNQGGEGPGGVVIAFYRSLFAGLVLLPLARGRLHTLFPPGAAPAPSRRRLRPAAFWCVIFFTLMTVCFVVANTKTEAANAIILQYTSTFWIFGLSPWILRERPQARDLWILTLAIVGIVIIFLGKAGTDLPGLVTALLAGLFFGLLTLMIRRMRDVNSAAVTVLNNLGSALLILPFLCLPLIDADGVQQLWVSRRSLVLLVVMGVVQFGIPYYLYTLGLARVPAYQAALLTMLEPILVPVWTYLAIGEVPHENTFFGGGLILVALLILLLNARRTPRPLAEAAAPRSEP